MSITTAPGAAVPADGISQVTLTIKLDPAVKSSNRTVSASTTAGTFVPASATNSSQTTATLDSLGHATAILQAPSVPATAIVRFSVADFRAIYRFPFARPPLRMSSW